MSVPKSHGRRTQPVRELQYSRYVCGTRFTFCGLLSKRANLYRGPNGQSVPCATGTKRLIDRDHQHPHPPPHSLQLFYHLHTAVFLPPFTFPHPTRVSINKNSSYMIAFPNRKINKKREEQRTANKWSRQAESWHRRRVDLVRGFPFISGGFLLSGKL